MPLIGGRDSRQAMSHKTVSVYAAVIVSEEEIGIYYAAVITLQIGGSAKEEWRTIVRVEVAYSTNL